MLEYVKRSSVVVYTYPYLWECKLIQIRMSFLVSSILRRVISWNNYLFPATHSVPIAASFLGGTFWGIGWREMWKWPEWPKQDLRDLQHVLRVPFPITAFWWMSESVLRSRKPNLSYELLRGSKDLRKVHELHTEKFLRVESSSFRFMNVGLKQSHLFFPMVSRIRLTWMRNAHNYFIPKFKLNSRPPLRWQLP